MVMNLTETLVCDCVYCLFNQLAAAVIMNILIGCNQGIIDCKGTETRQISFSYVCNGKKIKELFASTLNRITLNGIAASVRCVSSMIVALNVKLTRLIAAHADKRYG